MTTDKEIVISGLPEPHWSNGIVGLYLRLAASGYIPARWYLPDLLPRSERAARTGHLSLEIVSHCWNYAHLLDFQLSSLVLYPPKNVSVTMTVFYCREDQATIDMLAYFAQRELENVQWNWRALPRQHLFRRSIGRNHAARNTGADWIWFTDCDLMFRDQTIDVLGDLLQGSQDKLVHPSFERVTPLLPDDHPMLHTDSHEPAIVDIDSSLFYRLERTRATGPLQIVHGDVARANGYCESLPLYQTPSEKWCKAHEDRAFRWLLRTDGTALELPGVYRIRHTTKGRYTGAAVHTGVRSRIRRFTSWLRERRR